MRRRQQYLKRAPINGNNTNNGHQRKVRIQFIISNQMKNYLPATNGG